MMKNKKLSRFLSFIFAIVMVVGLLPSMSLRAAAADAMPTSGTVTLAAGKTYDFQGGTYTRTANFIIASGTVTVRVPANANVTVNGAFDATNKVGSPFTVRSGARLNLVINGKLTCNGGNAASVTTTTDNLWKAVFAGINVVSGGTLDISTETGNGSTSGVLIAQAGNLSGDVQEGSAAGIGGNGYKDNVAAESCGTVIIGKNTNVTAKGSIEGGSRGGGAGIGGGGGGHINGGNGGLVQIYGTVYAEGARGTYIDSGGAGIGGGGSCLANGGHGGDVRIYAGAVVTAKGSQAVQPGGAGGAGIGGGGDTINGAYKGGNSGNVFIQRGSKVTAVGGQGNPAGVGIGSGSALGTAGDVGWIQIDVEKDGDVVTQTGSGATPNGTLVTGTTGNLASVGGGFAKVTAATINRDIIKITTAPATTGTVVPVNADMTLSGTHNNTSYVVNSGKDVTVTITGDTTIDNRTGGGSPFDVKSGGRLKLIVNATLNVYGQPGGTGALGSIVDSLDTSDKIGGVGGSAGISVPSGAVLELDGSGTVNAYGGDAGDGGSCSYWGNGSGPYASGGGGAGAGIGGSGGKGGDGVASLYGLAGSLGGTGVSAGNIIVSSTSVQVNAYGGSGGSAGSSAGDAAAGGGYPGAGIGGGGAGGGGGDHGGNGGGGFSGGTSDFNQYSSSGAIGARSTDYSKNGESAPGNWWSANAGSYFNVNTNPGGNEHANGINKLAGLNRPAYANSGGTAGNGGTVVYANKANVHAYNGNYITTAASGAGGNEWGTKQTSIYAQLGFSLNDIRAQNITNVSGRDAASVTSNLSSVAKNVAVTEYGALGIGSGAGAYENDNGTAKEVKIWDISQGDLEVSGADNWYVTGTTTEYHITVAANATGTIYLDGVKIDLRTVAAKNPIDLAVGANVTINSLTSSQLLASFATETTVGMAAIHVPEGATVAVTGVLSADGGFALRGSNATDALGGNGGNGAGAGIGGNGGLGGAGGDIEKTAAQNGQNGETAGNITVSGQVTAIGGGSYNGDGEDSTTHGGGGGGYPAAGIGGGGAGGGGATEYGGDGFNGGAGIGGDAGYRGASGTSGTNFLGGNGYLEENPHPTYAGAGGQGGSAESISVSTSVTALNGSVHHAGGSARLTIKSQAVQGIGSGAGGTEVPVPGVKVEGAPNAPDIVDAELSGDRGAVVTFSVVDGATSYKILGPYGVNETYAASSLTAADGSYKVTLSGLKSNTTYKFTVYAVNDNGTSEGKTTGEVLTKGTEPAPAVGTVTAVAKNGRTVEVSWPIVGSGLKYEIKMFPLGLADEVNGGRVTGAVPEGVETVEIPEFTPTVSNNKYNKTVSGLYPGVVYRVELRAINATNEPGEAAMTRVATQWVPKAPEVTVTPVENDPDSMKVSFTQPENVTAGRVSARSYTVTRTVLSETGDELEDLEANWIFSGSGNSFTSTEANITLVWDSANTSYSFTDNGIEKGEAGHNGHTYIYTVHCSSAAGAGFDGEGEYTYAPRAPQNVSVNQLDNNNVEATTNKLTISWETPADNDREHLTGYQVYRVTVDEDGEEVSRTAIGGVIPHEAEKQSYSYTDLGLTPGETYYYVVKAVNGNGEGMDSVMVSGVTNPIANAVAGLTVEATSKASGHVTWKAPENPVNPVTGYVVSWTDRKTQTQVGREVFTVDDSGNPSDSRLNYSGGVYEFEIETGLTVGSSYENRNSYDVEVYAVSDAGNGKPSSLILQPWTQPSKPTNMKVEVDGNTGVMTVTWAMPTDDGKGGRDGAFISQFQVEAYRVINGVQGDLIGSGSAGKDLAYELTGLTPGAEYIVSVKAVNPVGAGPAETVKKVQKMVPSAPEYITVEATSDTTMKVTWGNAEVNGASITDYEVLVYSYNAETQAWGDLLTMTKTDSGITDRKAWVTYFKGGEEDYRIDYNNMNTGPSEQNLAHIATISNLDPGTRYCVAVRGNCRLDNNSATKDPGLQAVEYNARTMDMPAAVTSLTAEPKNESGTIEVTWGLTADNWDSPVTSYVVQIYEGKFDREEELDPDMLVEDQTYPLGTNSKIFNQLEDGQIYTVSVHAVNGINAAKPNEGHRRLATVTPRKPAAMPTELELVLTTDSEGQGGVLTWNDPTGAALGGDPLGGYEVFLTKSGGETQVLKTDQNGTPITGTVDGGVTLTLTPGTSTEKTKLELGNMDRGASYKIFVRVYTNAGAGADSETLDFKTWDYPGAPSSVRADATHNHGVILSWAYPVQDGDGGIAGRDDETHTKVDDFLIKYKESSATNWTELRYQEDGDAKLENGRYSMEIVDLVDGKTYQFQVYSINGVGVGSAHGDASVLSSSVPYAATLGNVATGRECAWISTITAPQDGANGEGSLGNGGSPITAYKLYAAMVEERDGVWAQVSAWVYKDTVAADADGNAANVKVPELDNGEDYWIAVCAVNDACSGDEISGNGAMSEPALVRVGKPEAPQNVSAEPAYSNTILCSFDAADDNGTPIDHYRIYTAPANENGEATEEFKPYNIRMVDGQPVAGDVVEFRNLTNVLYGTISESMAMYVTAVNAHGESVPSETVWVKVGTPKAPKITSLETTTDSVTINWSAADNNGLGLNGYYVYITDITDSQNKHTETRAVGSGVLTLTLNRNDTQSALEYGHKYSVQVSAKGLGGESKKSAAKEFSFGLPAAPTITEVISGEGQLTVKFTASGDTGAIGADGTPVPLKKFTVYANGKFPTDVNVADIGADGQYTAVIEGLANGTTYNIQVSAWNDHGEGVWSEGEPGRPATVPNAPTNVVGTATSDTSVQITWRDPTFDGGAEITGYIVRAYDKNDEIVAEKRLTKAEAKDNCYEMTGLETGSSYTFGVKAVNRVREDGGLEGRSMRATETFKAPGKPVLTVYESSKVGDSYTLTLKWDAPDYNGGTPIVGYKVYLGNLCKSGKNPVDTNMWTITGLSLGEEYKIRIEACNEFASTYSDDVWVTIGQFKAPEITNLYTTIDDADIGSGSIHIGWNGVDDATNYIIVDVDQLYDSLISKGLVNEADKPSAEAMEVLPASEVSNLLRKVSQPNQAGSVVGDIRSFTRTNRNVGDTYYISLVAYSVMAGYGMPTPVHAVTIGAPKAPELSSVKAGYKSVTASWTAPQSDGYGFEPDGYELMRDGKAVASLTVAQAANAAKGVTFALDEALCDGKAHAFAVRAVRTAEDGTKLNGLVSTSQTVTPWGDPIMPELHESDVILGNHTFTLYFDPADGNGRAVTRYAINWDGTEWPDALAKISEENGRMKAVVENVPNGEKREVYVTAYTDATCHSAEPEKKLFITTGIPEAPEVTLGAVNEDGTNAITVTYTEPPQVPDSTMEYYNVVVTDRVGNSEEFRTTENPFKVVSLKGQPLTNGGTYTVQMQAVNSIGPGLMSAAKKIQVGTPGVPKYVSTVAQQGKVMVNWTKPDANGTSDVIMYRIYVTDSTGTTFSQDADATATSAMLENLVNGETYKISVAAVNKVGEGVPSEAREVTPGTVPGVPRNVAAEIISDSVATVSWQPPAQDGGLEIRYYVVSGDGKQHRVEPMQTRSGTMSYDVEGLEAHTEYTFSVRAVNSIGSSEPGEAETKVTNYAPEQITLFSVSSMSSQLNVMWHPVEDTGGSELESYRIRVYNNSSLSQDALVVEKIVTPDFCEEDPELGSIGYTFGDPALQLGGKYFVTVAAKNRTVESYGEESKSMYAMLSGATADTAPGAPVNVRLSASDKSINVTWQAPSYLGAGVDSYTVYWKPSTSVSYSHKDVGDVTNTTITGLNNGTTYDVYVVAVNGHGEGVASQTKQATPITIETPAIPKITHYISAANSGWIAVYWEAANNAQSYNVYINGTLAVNTAELHYTIMPADPVTTYTVEVEAVNSGITSVDKAQIKANAQLNKDLGDGEIGDPDEDMDGVPDAVTKVKAPDAPTNLQAQNNGLKSVTLNWTAPASTGGKDEPLTIYTLYVNGEPEATFPANNMETGEIVTSYEYTKNGENVLETNAFTAFQLTVSNSVGESGMSNISNIYVPGSTAPTNLTVEETANFGEYKLSWDAPVNAEGLSGYGLQVNGTDLEIQLITKTDYVISLAAETTTVVRVYAMYGEEASKTTDAVVILAEVSTPAAPVIQSVTTVEDQTDATEGTTIVTVTWTDPTPEKFYNASYEILVGETANVVEATQNEDGTLSATVEVPADSSSMVSVKATNTQQSTVKSTVSTPVVYTPAPSEPPEEGAPEKVTALHQVSVEHTSDAEATVTLAWQKVADPENKGVTYKVYYAVYDGTNIPEDVSFEEWTGELDDTSDTEAVFTGTVNAGNEYMFYVTAAYNDAPTAVSPNSNMVVVNAIKEKQAPSVPTDLRAEYDKDTGLVTLSFTASKGDVTGYKVYTDLFVEGKQYVVPAELITWNTEGNSVTAQFDLVEGTNGMKAPETSTSFAFQVAALNGELESGKSAAATVETDPGEIVIPEVPGAPYDLRAVYRPGRYEVEGDTSSDWINPYFTVYWKAPEDENIVQFRLTLGTDPKQAIELNKADLTANEDGEYSTQIDCEIYGLKEATIYDVQIECLANVVVGDKTELLSSGPQAKAFKIARGVNQDNDGDGIADENIDKDGDGEKDSSMTINLVGNIVATGSSAKEKVVFEIRQGDAVVNPDNYTATVDVNGDFTIQIKATADTAPYTVKAMKVGCTSFTLTDITLSDVSTGSEVNLGVFTLYAGNVNGDEWINAKDLQVIKNNFSLSGDAATAANGDVNGDGWINAKDLQVAKNNFGKQDIEVKFEK